MLHISNDFILVTQRVFFIPVLENSSKLLNLARASGCTIIHAPISFEPGHDEISESCYGILAGVKEGSAFTKGEWGSDFAGKELVCRVASEGSNSLYSFWIQ